MPQHNVSVSNLEAYMNKELYYFYVSMIQNNISKSKHGYLKTPGRIKMMS